MRACHAVVAMGVLACTAGTSGARAQDPPRVVDVVVAAGPSDAEPLEGLVRELLGSLDVEVRAARAVEIDPRDVVDPPPRPPPALARVWIAASEEHATLYLADAPWERVLMRRVPLPQGLDEVGREQIGQIVRSAVEALLSGARIGLARADARDVLVPEREPPPPQPAPVPPAAPTPAPPPSSASYLALEVALGWSLQLWADGPELRHAPLLHGTLLVNPEASIRGLVAVGVDYRPTTRSETELVLLDLRSVDVRLEAGVEAALGSRTAVRAAAGLTIDVTAVEPRYQAGTPVDPAPPRDLVSTMVSLRLGVHHEPWDRWLVAAGVLVDVDLVDTRYVVVVGDREVLVLDPWSVRPAPYVTVAHRFP